VTVSLDLREHPTDRDDLVECPGCDGTGVPRRGHERCPMCAGAGFLQADEIDAPLTELTLYIPEYER
jgi:DnaJ-class molecular chaperone